MIKTTLISCLSLLLYTAAAAQEIHSPTSKTTTASTNISQQATQKPITFTPNATFTKLTINITSGMYNLRILHKLGVSHQLYDIKETQTIDISNISSKVFFVEIVDLETKKSEMVQIKKS